MWRGDTTTSRSITAGADPLLNIASNPIVSAMPCRQHRSQPVCLQGIRRAVHCLPLAPAAQPAHPPLPLASCLLLSHGSISPRPRPAHRATPPSQEVGARGDPGRPAGPPKLITGRRSAPESAPGRGSNRRPSSFQEGQCRPAASSGRHCMTPLSPAPDQRRSGAAASHSPASPCRPGSARIASSARLTAMC
jgi:hypothetical protein